MGFTASMGDAPKDFVHEKSRSLRLAAAVLDHGSQPSTPAVLAHFAVSEARRATAGVGETAVAAMPVCRVAGVFRGPAVLLPEPTAHFPKGMRHLCLPGNNNRLRFLNYV